MAITKQDVRDYVDARIQARKHEVRKAIEDAIHARLNPILDKKLDSPDFARLARISQQFVDVMSEMTTKIKYLKDNAWDIKRVIEAAENYGVGLQKCMSGKIFTDVRDHVYDPLYEVVTEYSFDRDTEVQSVALELGTLLAPEVKKLNALETLRKELRRAIDNEPNGKRAYNAVAALGVDITDFEEDQKRKGNLPMVVKLSVDVCLLNNNCS